MLLSDRWTFGRQAIGITVTCIVIIQAADNKSMQTLLLIGFYDKTALVARTGSFFV